MVIASANCEDVMPLIPSEQASSETPRLSHTTVPHPSGCFQGIRPHPHLHKPNQHMVCGIRLPSLPCGTPQPVRRRPRRTGASVSSLLEPSHTSPSSFRRRREHRWAKPGRRGGSGGSSRTSIRDAAATPTTAVQATMLLAAATRASRHAHGHGHGERHVAAAC
jgi:hypothetical protein